MRALTLPLRQQFLRSCQHFWSAAAALVVLATVTLPAPAQLQWDPLLTPATPSGGTGGWTAAATNWSNGSTDQAFDGNIAVFGGTAGTVTITGTVSATGVTFATDAYTITGGTLTLTAGNSGTITTGVGTDTIASIISGSAGLTKLGTGTLTLTGANNYTGGLAINEGTVLGNTIATFGAGAISLNGGTLATNQAAGVAFTAAQIITVGASGGTIDNRVALKLQISTAGGLTGSGTLTRNATANIVLIGSANNDFQISAANVNFTGAVVLNGGQNEISPNGLGTGLTPGNSITINSGAELTVSNGTLANPLFINAGANIGGDNGTSTYSGAVTVNGAFTIRLGDFYQSTNRNLIISGPITGAGAFTFLNANTTTAAAGAGQTLFLTGDNSGYATAIAIPGGYNLAVGAANSVSAGGVTITSSATALAGFGVSYDFGAAPIPTFTNALTGGATTGGVFVVDTTLAATTTIDLSTLGGGTMFLGSSTTGTYSSTTLTPSSGVYRLGGGSGTLTFPSVTLTGANNVVVGDSRANGNGTVIVTANQTYTGTTTINGGTLQLGNNSTAGGIGLGDVILGGGTLVFRRSDQVTFPNKITTTGASGTLAINNGVLVTLTSPANTLGAVTFNTTANGILDIGANDTGLATAGTGGVSVTAAVNGIINGTGGGRLRLGSSGGDIGAAAGVTLTINAPIISGAGTTIDFFNAGNGTVILNGANTYTGVNNIQTAILQVANIGSVNAASSNLGAQTTAANATLNIGGSATSTLRYVGTGETTNRVINLAGTTFGAILEQSGTGALKFTSAFTATANGVKTLTLGGSTTGTGEIAAAIVNSTSATSLTKIGTGTWTLSAVNTYTGTTTAGGGNLIVDYSQVVTTPTNFVSATSPLAFSGGTLTIRGQNNAVATSQTFASTAVNAGGGALVVNANSGPGTVVKLGAITRALGGTFDLTQPAGGVSATNGVTTTTANNTAGILGGYATVGGVDWAVSGASATVPITAYPAGSYTALTTAGGGTTTTTNFLQTDSTTLTAPVTANSLKITDTATGASLANGGNAITLNGTAGGLLYAPGTATNNYTISGTGVIGSGTASEFIVNTPTAGSTLTISSPIISSTATAGILTKTGAGTLVLAANSGFTGDIYVNGGTLQTGFVAGTTTFLGGTSGATFRRMFLNNGGTFASAATFNDNIPSTTNVGFVFVIGTGGGTFNVSNGTTFSLDDGSGTGTASTAAELQGAGDLTKSGLGTLAFGTGTNNFSAAFTGRLFINAGTVTLGGSSIQLGDTNNGTVVGSGAVLDVRGSSIAEPLVINGAGLAATPAGALANSNGTTTSTLSGPVTLGSNSSVGGTANLTFTNMVSGAFSLTKVGIGTVTLAGYDAYTGGTTVSAGNLVFGSPYAVPATGTISVATTGVVTLNNFATADVSATLAKTASSSTGVVVLGGTSTTADANFTNLPTLFLGVNTTATYTGTYTPPSTGTVNLGGGGGTLTFNQPLLASNVTNLVIGNGSSGGTVILTASNTFTGSTTLNTGGVLSIASDSALGAPTAGLVFNGGTLQITGTADNALPATRSLTLPGAGTFDINNAANGFTVSQSASLGGVLTKTGAGALTLGGALTTGSNIVVSNGTLNLTGTVNGSTAATTLAYGNSATTTIVNVSNNITAFATAGANIAGSVAVYNQTAGTVTVSPGTADLQYVSNAGYGYFNLTGGTYRDTQRFDITKNSTTGLGVGYIGGTGTLNNNNGDWMIIAYGGSGQLTVGPGGTVTRGGAANPLGVALNTNSYGILNIAGGSVDAGTAPIRVANSTSTATTNITAFVNVAGGTLSVGTQGVNSTATGSSGNVYYTFAGGTLRAAAALANGFAPATANGVTTTTTIYGPVDNSAATGNTSQNFAGGMVVDTNGFPVTLANVLNGPTGTGVAQSSLTVTGGTGYVGAPAVQFTGGTVTADGSPAAGYALITGGAITGIVITNPGSYSVAPTAVTLTGGGGTGGSVTLGSLVPNTAGGLTKIGIGTLTLSAANTYTGPTLVSAGTLALTGSLTGSNVIVNGPSAAFTQSAAGVVAGTGTTFTVTQGTAALGGINTYTGATTVATGSLAVTGVGTIAGSSALSVGSAATFGYQPAAAGTMTLASGSTLNLASGSTINSSFIGNTAVTDAATTAGTIYLAPTGAFTSGTTYTLLTAGSGLDTATYQVRNPTNYTFTTAVSPTAVTITPTAATALPAAFWKGGFAGNPAVWFASDGSTSSNWATDLAGTATPLVPGATTAVTFSATSATNQTGMTLGANMSIASLTVNSTNPVGLDSDLYTLTINTGGITVAAGAGAVTLNSNIALGAAQTWTNNNTTNPLTVGGLVSNGGFTLTLTGPASTNIAVSGVLDGTGGLTKTGLGTATLSGVNSYLGTTTVDQGTLAITGGNQTLGALTIGATVSGTNTSALNLSAATGNLTFNGALLVQTNSATANTISIGDGRTLSVFGAVTVGPAGTTTTTTKLTLTGANGTFAVGSPSRPTNAGFLIGGNSTTNVSNAATLDLSALGTFYANLGSGTFRVGDASNTNGAATGGSTLNLAPTSTINAATFTSDSPDSGVTQTIRLGSLSNIINANTIEIGGSAGGRSNGVLNFLTTTGTLTVRNFAGVGRANLNLAYGGTTTGSAPVTTADFSGHSVDLLLGTVNIGGRTGTSGGSSTGTLTFNTGTLDATGVTLAARASTVNTGTVTGTSSGTLNIGGGTATIGASGITVANNTSTLASNPSNGTVSVSGGSLTIGGAVTLGGSVNANGTSTANFNITGGTVNLGGNIAIGTATGTVTSTVTLNGGTLNAAGRLIGTTTAPITFAAQSGTLNQLGELNGGGGLTKSTANTLILEGVNTYTGTTAIAAGTLQIGSGGATGTPGTGAIVDNATLAFNRNNALAVSNAISGSGVVNHIGSGTTRLTGLNSYAGGTSITAGTLLVNGQTGTDSGTGTNAVTASGTGTFGGTGRAAGAVTINSGGTLRAGDPTVNSGTGTLTTGADVTFNSGATFSTRVITAGPAFTGSNFGASGTPGIDNNFLSVVGNFTLPSSGLTVSIDGTGVTFDVSGTTTYSYKVAQASGTVTPLAAGTPFTAATFLPTGFFANNFSLNTDGIGGVYVNFTPQPVPEPATVFGLAVGGLLAGRCLRRRWVKTVA